MRVISLYKERGELVSAVHCEFCGSMVIVYPGAKCIACPSCGFNELILFKETHFNEEVEDDETDV